jgi:hypothetical protein
MRFILLIFSISLTANFNDDLKGLGSSYNSFGQVGLIQTPTADSKQEGSVAFTYNKNNIWKFGTLSVSPFDWLEASYFYYRPSDLTWNGTPGLYLDKGFNVKFKYKSKKNNIPDLAIGLDDFAGTGLFTREYIVATQELRDIKVTAGLGWGKFAGKNSFDNPLSFISDEFKTRPLVSEYNDEGGTLSFDKWFRGNAALFGGLEYFIPSNKRLSIKLEYDPYDYVDFSAQNNSDASFSLRKKDSDINVGVSYSLNRFVTLDASFIKGNIFNISFTIGATFNEKLVTKPSFNPSITSKKDNKSKIAFYESILLNLNNNNLFLQTASLTKKDLNVSISTSEYRNSIRSASYAASIIQEVSKNYDVDLATINIAHINVGIEANNITFFSNHLEKNNNTPVEIIKRYTKLNSGNKYSYEKHNFKPKVNFPAIFSTTSPIVISSIGSPEKFYYGGIDITNISEVQFSRKVLLSTQINYAAINNFDDVIYNPQSVLEHVRTDNALYLKASDLYLKRMQLDYIWTPKKNVYAKLSGGIFEDMYGGFGGQVLYKPFDSNFNISLEGFYVKQRDYDRLFTFKEYKTFTGHLNIGYLFPYGIESNISFGRYLAKDDGFTFDLSRRTESGFKAGVYFTRTDVSALRFGEGSFDKGFYIQVPMDLFSKSYRGSYSNFNLSPLNRDGGAKLKFDKDLRGLMYNATLNELKQGWKY